MLKKNTTKKRTPKSFKFYPVSQCALYKVGSKKRLGQIMRIPPQQLIELAKDCRAHYREFSTIEKVDPFSGKKTKSRKVQEPQKLLRRLHERLLFLLQRIEPPPFAHAGVKLRSYRSNADTHRASKHIATFDLAEFYPSTARHLIYDFFRYHMKCAEDVAGLLAQLTTLNNRLPTGSPISPLLSLYAALPMMSELANLATENNLIFTSYVDDLTFSGEKIPKELARKVRLRCKKHGYNLNTDKTKIFKQNSAAHITGVVVYNGALRVPFGRFVKARSILSSISGKDKKGFSQDQLFKKLEGLLNEASYLDSAYKDWSYITMNKYRRFLDPK